MNSHIPTQHKFAFNRDQRQFLRYATVFSLVGVLVPVSAQPTATAAHEGPITATSADNSTASSDKTDKSAPKDWLLPASWQAGDWRAYFAFVGQLRYDDNILQTDRRVLSDFVGVEIPSVNLDYTPSDYGGAVLAHADYAPQFLEYFSHSGYDTINHDAHVNFDATFGRSEFRLSHRFQLTSEPQIEESERSRIQIQSSDLSVSYELTAKTEISVNPRQEWSHYDNGLTVWEYGAALGLTHHQTAKLDWKTSYYGARIDATPGITAYRQVVKAGISWQVTARSQLDLHAGFQSMTYAGNDSADGTLTPEGGIGWLWQLTGRTSAHLSVGYETDISRYNAYQLNKVFNQQLTLSHNLTEKVGLELRGGYALLDQSSVVRNQPSNGQLQYWNIGCGVVYHFNRRTDFTLDYDHQQRGSNNIFGAYQRNVAQFSIKYRF